MFNLILVPMLLLVSLTTNASPIDCSTINAIANTTISTSCITSSLKNSSTTTETDFIARAFDEDYDLIIRIDENEKDVAEDWDIVITDGSNYSFNYSLTSLTSFDSIDIILGIKQGTMFTAYLFEHVSLDIIGSFNSYSLGRRSLTPEDDYSHVTLWAKPSTIPEPSIMWILLSGLPLVVGLSVINKREQRYLISKRKI